MKTGFITFEKAGNRPENSVGSSRIRARWVWKYWDDAEEWTVGKKYDAIIFQKVYWDELMDNFSGIKILDLCDPDWLEGRDVMKYVDMADAVTTSTQALADYILKFSPNKIVRCIPDRIDLEEHKTVKTEHASKLQQLVWFGYSTNFQYISDILEDSKGRDIFKKNGLSLTIYTDTQMDISNKAKESVKFIWKKYEYSRMHEELIKFDAAFFPSSRDTTSVRGKYKSNNKLLTCKALGLPIIQEPEDIDKLLSKQSRIDLSNEGIKEVQDKWDVRHSVADYIQLIKDIQATHE